MGDVRFEEPYLRVKNATHPATAIHRLSDEDVVAALSAAALTGDKLMANVLATEGQNRLSLYGAVQTTMAEGVFAVGPEGLVTVVNPAAQKLLGWAPHEVIGQDMDTLLACTVVDGQGSWTSRAVCADALQTRTTQREEDALFARKDGSRFPVSYVAAPILREGDVRGAVVVFRDITARRETEENVRRLANIVQAADDAIFSRDLEGHIMSWNDACERLFGYAASEAIGRHFDMLTAPHRASEDDAVLRRVERGETVRQHETQRITKDGRFVDVSVSLVRLRSPEGRIVGYASINRDIRARVRAVRALREARHLLGAVVEGTTDIIYAKDQEGRYLFFNAAGARLLETSQDELVGKRDTDFLDPVTADAARADELAIMEQGAPRTFEEPVTIAGREHVFLTTKAPLRDADGNVAGIVGISHDITERKKAERATRRLAAIVEASDDAILSLDLDGRILTWNPRAEELYGYSAAEAIGKNADIVVPEDLRTANADLLARVRRGEHPHHHVTMRLQRGGKLLDIDLTATPILDQDNQVVALSWVGRDVTEAKRHEEALRRSEERYRLLLDSATEHAIFQLDPEGHIMSWNPAAERIKGWKEEEVLGRHYKILFPPEEVAAGDPWKELDDAATKGRHDGEERRMRKDGTLFDASVTLSAMRDRDERLVGFVKVTRDVSERKAWERRLQTGEQRYNHIFESLDKPTIWCEPDGTMVRANAALRARLDLEESAIVGRPFKSLAALAERDRIDEVTAALADGAARTVTFTVVDQERPDREVRWTLTPISVGSMMTGFFAAVQDVSSAPRQSQSAAGDE